MRKQVFWKYFIVAIGILSLLLGTGYGLLGDNKGRQNIEGYDTESESTEEETENTIQRNAESEQSEKTLPDSQNFEEENVGEASEEDNWLVYDYWGEWTGSDAKYDLPYADDETFAIIKEAYGNVEFAGVFEKGDTSVYDDYKSVFMKLLKNEMTFYDSETGKEICLKDFEGLMLYDKSTDRHTKYDVSQYKYIFFDIDEDGSPELGIRNSDNYNAVYIFRYDVETEKCFLWYTMYNGYYELFGSRKMAWIWDGKYITFYQLNANGEVECETFGTSNWKNDEVSQHTVMLPQYADKEKEVPVTDAMKAQGIYERSTGQWFFRVTEAQYNELMEPYWEAYDLAEQEIKKVTYTYEELFGSN